jgi:hydrogenase small subunit
MPGFTDAYEPFYQALPSPKAPTGASAEASLVGAAVVGAAAAYGLSKLHEKKVEEAKSKLEEGEKK